MSAEGWRAAVQLVDLKPRDRWNLLINKIDISNCPDQEWLSRCTSKGRDESESAKGVTGKRP